jgi:hypothetical protein
VIKHSKVAIPRGYIANAARVVTRMAVAMNSDRADNVSESIACTNNDVYWIAPCTHNTASAS